MARRSIEEVASVDDALMEKFFEDPDSITSDELIAAIRKATISMTVVRCSAVRPLKNKGVQLLLDYVMAFLPSPVDIEAVIGTDPRTGEETSRKPVESDPFCGLAFKIATDPFVAVWHSSAFIPERWKPVLTCTKPFFEKGTYQPYLPDACQ